MYHVVEQVASLAEAWIEIMELTHKQKVVLVASLAEAWIEILKYICPKHRDKSPPSRRRGLKSNRRAATPVVMTVASLAEAWIEIAINTLNPPSIIVASLAEAWIEIYKIVFVNRYVWSPPSRRRGLKL